MNAKPVSAVLRLDAGRFLWVVYQGLALRAHGCERYADAAEQRADDAALRLERGL